MLDCNSAIATRAAVLIGNLALHGPLVLVPPSSRAVVVVVGVGMDAILAIPLVLVPALPPDLGDTFLAGPADCVGKLDELKDILLLVLLASRFP